jgi:hypothetical protein
MASASEPQPWMWGPFRRPIRRLVEIGLRARRQMTNQPTTSRFVLRKGAAEGKWMIWDRELRGPAKLERGFARELSEEQARKLLGQLTRADSGKCATIRRDA